MRGDASLALFLRGGGLPYAHVSVARRLRRGGRGRLPPHRRGGHGGRRLRRPGRRRAVQQPTLVTNWSQFTQTFGEFVEGSYLAHSVYGYFMNGGGSCYVVRVGGNGAGAGRPGRAHHRRRRRRWPPTGSLALEAGTAGNDITVEVADPQRGLAGGHLQARRQEGRQGRRGVRQGHGQEGPHQRRHHGQRPVEADPAGGDPGRRSARGARPRLGDAGRRRRSVRPIDARRLRRRRRPPHRLRRPGGHRPGHHGRVPRPDGRLPEGHDRPGGRPGRPAGHDRPLRADGRPGRRSSTRRRASTPSRSGSGGSTRPATTPSTPPCTGRGSRSSTRRAGRASSSRPAGTSPASGAATTTAGASTRRRPTRSSGARSSLEIQITKNEHDLLNPVGINCIRAFPGRGIRVWGARTLSSPTRPGATSTSAACSTTWRSRSSTAPSGRCSSPTTTRCGPRSAAPSPRSSSTSGARARCSALTPDQAFYVKCDDETNPAGVDRRRHGRLRDRRRPGQAGRVRRLPAVPVLRRRALTE